MKRIFTLVAFILFALSANAQLTNGLVAHWQFSGNANDATSNGHNGTATNVTYTAGKMGVANTAALFNGTSSFITVPNSTDWNLTNFTIAAMVKINGFYTNLCQASYIVERGGGHTSGNWGLALFDNAYDSSCTVTGDTSKFTFYGEAGPNNTTIPHAHWQYTPTARTGRWYCVITTFDGTYIKVYVDGVNVSTAWRNTPVPIGTSNNIVAIGANRFGNYTQYPYWFNGAIDDLRVYNRVLSPTEISSFCNLFDTSITITTNLSGKQLCGDDTFHLSYTVSPNFGSSNVFTAQLSDATGSFANPQNIGTIASAAAGTIICTTPTGLTPGNGYRVRIVGSNPVRYSDVSSTFGIYPTLTPSATIAATPSGPVAANQYITFVATPVDAGLSPSFQWYRNGTSIPGATDDTLYINTLNDSDIIHVVVASSNPCPADLTAQSDSIVVRILSSVHELKLDNLNLYPNPAKNHITITADNVTNDILLEVVNAMGQIVHRKYAAQANGRIAETVETGNMASGIYILRISSDGYQRNTRFTVNR
jgi:hypothetical protein